jgi:hypothetical protein
MKVENEIIVKNTINHVNRNNSYDVQTDGSDRIVVGFTTTYVISAY